MTMMINRMFGGIMMLGLLALQSCTAANSEANPWEQDPETINYEAMDTATFGNGCFWCTEAVFQRLEGVVKAESGYSGGKIAHPTYKEVCSGLTGHAEVIQITYDPEKISYRELLEVFFKTHDPTTLNRQGADVGTQYRSAIFYHSEKQKEEAEAVKKELDAAGIWPDPIVTEITAFDKFYVAENYHQDYYEYNQQQPYCKMVITPKLEKFEEVFKDKLKPTE